MNRGLLNCSDGKNELACHSLNPIPEGHPQIICNAEFYAWALDQTAIVAATNTKGKIIYANEQFARISGYPVVELIGKNHRILNSGHHPSIFFKQMYRKIARGDQWRGEIKNRAKNGSTYWVDTTIIPAKDESDKILGYISIRIDITTRKVAEEELLAQNLRLDAALSNMSQALLMFDSTGQLEIVNRRYIEMYGLSTEIELRGRTLRELLEQRKANGTFSENIDDYVTNLRTAIANGLPSSHVVELSDGRTIVVLNSPMANGGWVATHEDITERRRAELQIVHLVRHNSLTDLPNRVLLLERLEQSISNWHGRKGLAVLYLDLDRFQNVNDTFGHPVGDALLKMVAERLLSSIRETDIVARLSGDEFAIVQITVDSATETTNSCAANL